MSEESGTEDLGRSDPQEAATAKPASKSALETQGLSYRYGKFEAVRNLSLSVLEGEIYGFLGRNGAGKTTTIKLLMGMLKSRTGSVRCFDLPPSRRTDVAAKRRIGYVSQEQHFYPWMTGDALGRFVGRLYPSWDDDEFLRLLARFEIPRNRRSGALSSGMRTKLALALALAPKPDLLVLDEPMAGLDAVARREFLDLVQDQSRADGRTTFFSSHRIHEVERICDRIGMIDRGSLVYEGTIAALQASVRELRRADVEGQEAPPLPDGTSLLHEEVRDGFRSRIVRAQEGTNLDGIAIDGDEVREVSLEDIFVAMLRDQASGMRVAR
ncbi:MAG: ABC transporter ATP-binding protein [Planctomycetota bacterium]